MKPVIYAATAAAAAAFFGALALFTSFAGGVPWRAFDRVVERPGRVPAVEAPDEPLVLTMTASDVDSVPAALEARPRAEPAPEPPVALGDVEPAAPRPKAAGRKTAARKSTVLRRVGLGGARRALELGAPAAFDGGGSGAFAGPGQAAEASGGEEASASAPTSPARVRPRSFRGVMPSRGSVAPAPAPASAPAPAQEDGGAEEPDGE